MFFVYKKKPCVLKNPLKFALIFTFLISEISGAQEVIHDKRKQIEDIFIWKISDELKLSAKEEKTFGEIQRQLNQKKQNLNEKLNQLYTEAKAINLSDDKNKFKKKKTDLLIKDVKLTLKQINEITIAELNLMQSALGAEKLLQYLVIKNEINNKLKGLLAAEKMNQPVKKTETELKPPVIIEEK